MSARGIGELAAGVATRAEPGRRTHQPVRRNSFDVDDPAAKPWKRIGDGSFGQGIAFVEAVLQTARELYREEWRATPARAARDAKGRRDAVVRELAAYQAAGTAPIGAPALLRIELSKIDEFLARFEARLQRTDLTVLEAMLRHHLDFRTGKLFPRLEEVADKAGCHRNSVIDALRRLKAKGFITWIRRSLKTGAKGVFGPQCQQTSSAYHFEHRERMAKPVWQRFAQLLTIKLRRMGKAPPDVDRSPPRQVADPELRATLSRFAALVANAST